MTKNFSPYDISVLRSFEEKRRELHNSLVASFVKYATLTKLEGYEFLPDVVKKGIFSVPDPTNTTFLKNAEGKDIEVFLLQEFIGGDAWSYNIINHFLPADFYYGESRWLESYEEAVEDGWVYTPIPSTAQRIGTLTKKAKRS